MLASSLAKGVDSDQYLNMLEYTIYIWTPLIMSSQMTPYISLICEGVIYEDMMRSKAVAKSLLIKAELKK